MENELEKTENTMIEEPTNERQPFAEWFARYAKALLIRAFSFAFFLLLVFIFCVAFYKIFFVYHFLGLAFKVALGNIPFSYIPLAAWGWLVAWLISWAAISLEVNIAERQLFGPRR